MAEWYVEIRPPAAAVTTLSGSRQQPVHVKGAAPKDGSFRLVTREVGYWDRPLLMLENTLFTCFPTTCKMTMTTMAIKTRMSAYSTMP